MTATAKNSQTGPITLAEFSDMLEVSQLLQTVDLGDAIVHKVCYQDTIFTLVSTAGGKSCCVV